MGNYKRRFVNKQMLAYYHNKVKALLDLKSDKTHTHKYAGSDTVGGVANSAYKLQTGRKITISDDLMGEVVFNGTKDVVINVTNYRVNCSSNNTVNYPWHRIASVGKVTESWQDKDCVLSIRQTYDGGCYGILKISLRTNNVSSGNAPSCSARWLLRSKDFAADTVKIGYRAENGSCYLDVFAKCGQYARMIISQIEGDRLITLVESSEASNTTASSKGNSVEVYKSVEEAGPAIHNKLSYTTISNAVDDTLVDRGNVAARLARNADFANPMTFNWSGKDGQPTWLWGGENGADMYVYNPSKFRVAHADSAARLDIEGTIGSANKPVYFKNGNPVESNFTVDKSVPSNAKFTDTVYTHPTSSGNKHIPAGGNSGQILRWASDGTAKWGADQDTTYSTGKNLASSGTTFRLADICDTVTDWNTATTMGFFMAYGASNAPVGSTWFYGQVIAHNTNYVRQILYRFSVDNSVNGGNCDRYERVRQNGAWGEWTNTSVRQYVPLAGGTMTGILHMKGDQYTDSAATGSLDMANSDIYNINSLKFADQCESASEGIQWYRDDTHADSLWDKDGVLYYTPNRPWGLMVDTGNVILHSGNYSSYALPLSGGTMSGNVTFSEIGDAATSKGLHWSGSTDGADIFYRTDSKDHGRLVLNITDDADARIDFALNKVTKSYIDADGNFSGKASTAGTADVANSVAWGNVSGKPSTYTPSSHTHSSVSDIGSGASTTFAYSKTGLNYGDYIWLAGWNGYELRAVNKNHFATAGHTHNYAGSSSAGGVATSAYKLWATSHPDSWYLNSQWDGTYFQLNYKHDNDVLPAKIGYAGIADVANSVPWDYVSGKPSSYTPSSHTHTKSQISDFPTSLPASDVYAWAKASTKPSYSASEVGAVSTSSSSTVNGAITFGGEDSFGIYTIKDNYVKIGMEDKAFFKAYINRIFPSSDKYSSTQSCIGSSDHPFANGCIKDFRSKSIRDMNGNKYLCYKEASVTGTNSAGNAYFTDESSDLAKKASQHHIWMALVANPPGGGQYICMPFRTWRGAIGLGSLNGENYVWGVHVMDANTQAPVANGTFSIYVLYTYV